MYRRFLRLAMSLTLASLLLSTGTVMAQGSIGAAFGTSATGSSVTVSGSYSPFTWGTNNEYAAGLRAEASFAPGIAGTAFGAAAILSARQETTELYTGAGAGIASGGFLTVYGFTGVRFQLYDSLYGAVEFNLAGNSVYTAYGVRVGIDWLFGRGGQ